MSGRAVQREAVEALRSFGAACAALTRLGSALPKPLVQLVDAAHTLANVTAVRLEGKNPSVGDLACESRAWEDVARAQAGWPAQQPGQEGRVMIRIEGATDEQLDVLRRALAMLACHFETGTVYMRHADVARMGGKTAQDMGVSVKLLNREQRRVVDVADDMWRDLLNRRADVPTTDPAKIAADPFDTEV